MSEVRADFANRGKVWFAAALGLSPLATCPIKSGQSGLWLDSNGSPDLVKFRLADGTDITLPAAQEMYAPVDAVSASNIAGTYSSGVFTVTATGALTVDGVTATLGKRILLQTQTTTHQQGIYIVTTAGDTGISPVLTRASDMSVAAEFANGALVYAKAGGGSYGSTLWGLSFSGAFTVGTTTPTFTQFATAVTFTAVNAALAAADADIGVNSHKLTGLSAGSAAGDSLRWEQGGMQVSASNTGTVGAATKYMSPPGGAGVNASQIMLAVVTRAGVLRNLRVALGTAPGGSDTVAFTVQKSSDQGSTWSDTTLTATISAAAKSASDTSHNPAVAAGDYLALKMVSSAGTAAAPAAGFEVL